MLQINSHHTPSRCCNSHDIHAPAERHVTRRTGAERGGLTKSQPIPIDFHSCKGGVEAQCLSQRPHSALSQAIFANVKQRNGGVEAHCLCQRPPSSLSQTIPANVEKRKGGVEAHCFCLARPPPSWMSFPSRFSSTWDASARLTAPVLPKRQSLRRNTVTLHRAFLLAELYSVPHLNHRISLFCVRRRRLRRLG
jgi:hypothetical protein